MSLELDFPELRSEHVDGAKLYATREDMVSDLTLPPNPKIAEVGVALGSFSKILISRFHPAEFHAFDLFQLHQEEMLWGKMTSEVLDGKSHVDFYRDTMMAADAHVIIHEGPSGSTLQQVPSGHLDLVYIDGAHTYDAVLQDARECARALKGDGVLIFNDYIIHDPFVKADYGIVQVVNQMVVNEGWQVIGFALQKHLFCDIAVKRRSHR